MTEGRFIARLATHEDREAFLDLAREAVAANKSGLPFDENAATYTFSGLDRADPMIQLLLEGDELIGFALTRTRSMPFCSALRMDQEMLFIREGKWTPLAEACLHDLAHSAAVAMNLAELHLHIPVGQHATPVYEFLCRGGYQAASAHMVFVGGDTSKNVTGDQPVRSPGTVMH